MHNFSYTQGISQVDSQSNPLKIYLFSSLYNKPCNFKQQNFRHRRGIDRTLLRGFASPAVHWAFCCIETLSSFCLTGSASIAATRRAGGGVRLRSCPGDTGHQRRTRRVHVLSEGGVFCRIFAVFLTRSNSARSLRSFQIFQRLCHL